MESQKAHAPYVPPIVFLPLCLSLSLSCTYTHTQLLMAITQRSRVSWSVQYLTTPQWSNTAPRWEGMLWAQHADASTSLLKRTEQSNLFVRHCLWSFATVCAFMCASRPRTFSLLQLLYGWTVSWWTKNRINHSNWLSHRVIFKSPSSQRFGILTDITFTHK